MRARDLSEIVMLALVDIFISKGKAGTRRSSTKTCEGYLVFSITSTESHTG